MFLKVGKLGLDDNQGFNRQKKPMLKFQKCKDSCLINIRIEEG